MARTRGGLRTPTTRPRGGLRTPTTRPRDELRTPTTRTPLQENNPEVQRVCERSYPVDHTRPIRLPNSSVSRPHIAPNVGTSTEVANILNQSTTEENGDIAELVHGTRPLQEGVDNGDSRDSIEEGEEEEDIDNGVLPRPGPDFDTTDPSTEKDHRNRKRIEIVGNMFKDRKVVMNEAISIMQAHFNGAWRGWKEIPQDVKDEWWQEFENRFYWNDEDSNSVWGIWKNKLRDKVRQDNADAKRYHRKPKYRSIEKWAIREEELKKDPKYQETCARNKRNRASMPAHGAAIHCGGSKPVLERVIDYEKKHKKRMSAEKLYSTAFQKGTGEWPGDGPKVVMDKFKEMYEPLAQTNPEGVPQKEIDRMWAEAAGGGGNHKDHVIGFGALCSKKRDFRNPADKGPSASSIVGLSLHEFEELKRAIANDVKQQIEDNVRKSMAADFEQRLAQQRQQDYEVLRRQLMEEHDFAGGAPTMQQPELGSFVALLNSTNQVSTSPNTDGQFASIPTQVQSSLSYSPSMDASVVGNAHVTSIHGAGFVGFRGRVDGFVGATHGFDVGATGGVGASATARFRSPRGRSGGLLVGVGAVYKIIGILVFVITVSWNFPLYFAKPTYVN